jgi:hypothetical protein
MRMCETGIPFVALESMQQIRERLLNKATKFIS